MSAMEDPEWAWCWQPTMDWSLLGNLAVTMEWLLSSFDGLAQGLVLGCNDRLAPRIVVDCKMTGTLLGNWLQQWRMRHGAGLQWQIGTEYNGKIRVGVLRCGNG